MEGREEIIRRWFAMWLEGKDQGIREIFAEDCVYVESWGPIYHGMQAVEHWFSEWNTRGKVVTWEIRQFFHQGDQTVVEWYFQDQMEDGRAENFDGVSLIRWEKDGKIGALKEFGCKLPHYDPYETGEKAQLQNEDMWT